VQARQIGASVPEQLEVDQIVRSRIGGIGDGVELLGDLVLQVD
jgi:hypothetical protein